jgi:hypothetical protein
MITKSQINPLHRQSKNELVGLPGSGKTTLGINMSTKQSNTNFINKISKFDRFFYGTMYSFYDFFTFIKFLKIILKEYRSTIHPGLKHKFFFTFLSACAREMKGNFYRNCTIDEGLCQFVYSVYEHEITYEEILKDFSFLTKKKHLWKIIYVEADELVRTERYTRRGRRFRDYVGDNEYQKKIWKVIEENDDIIKTFFLQNFDSVTVKS